MEKMFIHEEKLKRIKSFYEDRIKGWMISDLNKGIKAEANFLTALGCFVYTEAVGHLLPPLIKEIGKPNEKSFYRCLFRFNSHDYLRELDKSIRKTGGHSGIYEMRHAMVHRYYPTPRKKVNDTYLFISTVVALDGIIRGIEFEESVNSPLIFMDDSRRIAIALNNYVREFKECVDKSFGLCRLNPK
jgi:hypothetical protein